MVDVPISYGTPAEVCQALSNIVIDNSVRYYSKKDHVSAQDIEMPRAVDMASSSILDLAKRGE